MKRIVRKSKREKKECAVEKKEDEQRGAHCREGRRKTQHLQSECWAWDVPSELTRLEDKVGSFISTKPKRHG